MQTTTDNLDTPKRLSDSHSAVFAEFSIPLLSSIAVIANIFDDGNRTYAAKPPAATSPGLTDRLLAATEETS